MTITKTLTADNILIIKSTLLLSFLIPLSHVRYCNIFYNQSISSSMFSVVTHLDKAILLDTHEMASNVTMCLCACVDMFACMYVSVIVPC